jgi:hypothetical protein
MINGELIGIGVEVGLQESINSLLEDFLAHAIPMGGKVGYFTGLVWDENGMPRARMERA